MARRLLALLVHLSNGCRGNARRPLACTAQHDATAAATMAMEPTPASRTVTLACRECRMAFVLPPAAESNARARFYREHAHASGPA